MKKVLFISPIDKESILLSYLMPYQVERGYSEITNPYSYSTPVKSWFENKAQSLENLEKHYKFLYHDIEIDYKIVDFRHSDAPSYEAFARQQKKEQGYDKVYAIIRKMFEKDFNWKEWNFTDKNALEVVYLNIIETFHETDDIMKQFLQEHKVISASQFNYVGKNFYYDPFLNPLYFYYTYGFDFLPLKQLEVKKTNLLGMYLRKNYKPLRDSLYEEIKQLFSEKELLEIYTIEPRPSFLTDLKTLHLPTGWDKNHITSYLDYITSVCGFVFETSNYSEFNWPCGSINRHYITEKTLKAIMYSKLNTPFIIDMNPYIFVELNKLGFWFLNTEFFDFEQINSDEDISQNMKSSIFKSIEFILGLYNETKCLQQTHSKLTELFSEKMQNNFYNFKNYLKNPKNNEKLLNFILDYE
jgi:hypothetical protein